MRTGSPELTPLLKKNHHRNYDSDSKVQITRNGVFETKDVQTKRWEAHRRKGCWIYCNASGWSAIAKIDSSVIVKAPSLDSDVSFLISVWLGH